MSALMADHAQHLMRTASVADDAGNLAVALQLWGAAVEAFISSWDGDRDCATPASIADAEACMARAEELKTFLRRRRAPEMARTVDLAIPLGGWWCGPRCAPPPQPEAFVAARELAMLALARAPIPGALDSQGASSGSEVGVARVLFAAAEEAPARGSLQARLAKLEGPSAPSGSAATVTEEEDGQTEGAAAGGGGGTLMDPTQWLADHKAHACLICSTTFTLLNRRHHCRACGGVFCGQCTPKQVRLSSPSKEGSVQPKPMVERVCLHCYGHLLEKRRAERAAAKLAGEAVPPNA